MLLKVDISPQESGNLIIDSTISFVAEVVSCVIKDGYHYYNLSPEYLGCAISAIAQPPSSSLLIQDPSIVCLVKKDDLMMLKWDALALEVDSVQEVADFPLIQRRYKR